LLLFHFVNGGDRMSRVNLESAQNNIERLASNLNELIQVLTSKKGEIDSKVRDFSEELASFFKEVDEINQSINSGEEKKTQSSSQLDQLSNELQEITYRKDVLQSEITSKQRDIEQLSALILEREKISTEANLQVDSLNERISDLRRKIEEFDVLTNALNEETKEHTRAREIKLAELDNNINRVISRSKSLQFLVKKDIVTLPEIQVLRSLNTPGVDTAENLKKTSGVSDDLIRKILQDLARREIIQYDPTSGRFQILTSIDI